MQDSTAADEVLLDSSKTSNPQPWNWWNEYGILLVAFSPLVPQLVGSFFNIFYNVVHIEPLFADKPGQQKLFLSAIAASNLVVYPAGVVAWVWTVRSIRKSFNRLLKHETLDKRALLTICRRTINLPWWISLYCGVAWISCIPGILGPLLFATDPVDRSVFFHMPISILIGGVIGVTHAFFAVELTSQQCLFPVMFRELRPSKVPGTFPLSFRGRGVMWALSAVICPVVCLLLLVVTPHSVGRSWFALAVAGFAILLGLSSAWMLAELIGRPVNALRVAARDVAGGYLNTRIDVVRADEFGPLIDEFNQMVGQLREKQRLQDAFGRHVGQEAARQILQQDPNLLGAQRTITVLFADLRNFTESCSKVNAHDVVQVLNIFFSEMVAVIEERHEGMVNKFLGDGLMALFGADHPRNDHADLAVSAAQEMLIQLESVNERLVELGHGQLSMGIGIHTGPAIVGSIGSPGRGDYTAIGDTVNTASRVESITKTIGSPLLLTEETYKAMNNKVTVKEFPPQEVKGKSKPLIVFGTSTAN